MLFATLLNTTRRRLWISSPYFVPDDVTIIDTAEREVIKSVPVGLVPYGILIDD